MKIPTAKSKKRKLARTKFIKVIKKKEKLIKKRKITPIKDIAVITKKKPSKIQKITKETKSNNNK